MSKNEKLPFSLLQFAQIAGIGHRAQAPAGLVGNGMPVFFQFRLATHDEIVAAGLEDEHTHAGADSMPFERFFVKAVIALVAILATPTHGIEVALDARQ